MNSTTPRWCTRWPHCRLANGAPRPLDGPLTGVDTDDLFIALEVVDQDLDEPTLLGGHIQHSAIIDRAECAFEHIQAQVPFTGAGGEAPSTFEITRSAGAV